MQLPCWSGMVMNAEMVIERSGKQVQLLMIDPNREFLNETLKVIQRDRSRTVVIDPVLDREMKRSLQFKWAPISVGVTLLLFTGGFASFFLGVEVLGPVLYLLGIFSFLFMLFPVILTRVKVESRRYELADVHIEIENFTCRSRYRIEFDNMEKITKLNKRTYRRFFKFLEVVNRKGLLSSCSPPYLN